MRRDDEPTRGPIPTPKAKVPHPPADHWVWQVTFSDGQAKTSFVILDYDTGQLIESGVATP